MTRQLAGAVPLAVPAPIGDGLSCSSPSDAPVDATTKVDAGASADRAADWLADDHDDLDDVFDGGDPVPARPIDGDDIQASLRVDWHLRRLRRIRHDLAVLDAVYRAELDRLEERHLFRRRILQRNEAWHVEPLQSWHAMRLARDGVKSIELPNGTLRSRTPAKPRVVVVDPAAVAAWAGDELPDVYEMRPHVHHAVLARYVHQSGEIPPGVELEPPRTVFTVDTDDRAGS